MSHKQRHAIDRRTLLRLMTNAGVATVGAKMVTNILGFSNSGVARAATGKSPFLLYIHCGAWDGLAAGLLQPKDVGEWPIGLFNKNQAGGSNNPNLNAHVKTHDLVLNGYNSFLAEIADHLCFTTGTPQSLDHFEAEAIQTSGTKQGGPSPSWIVGFAEAIARSQNGRTLAVPEDDTAADFSPEISRVNVAKAQTIAGFVEGLTDQASVPGGDFVDDGKSYWDVVRTMHQKKLLVPGLSSSFAAQAASGVGDLLNGAPELAAGGSITTEVESKITLQAVDNVVLPLADAAGIKTQRATSPFFRNQTKLVEQLRLAAALIKSRRAAGMMIGAGQLGDFHNGGSSVITARESSQLFAHLLVFWRWVKENGLENDVMVVVSHEFTRTPYNNIPGPETDVAVFGTNGERTNARVKSPGTDHHLAMGMVFLNGRVPPGGRVGGLGDLFVPFGGSDLKGSVDADVPAYTSSQLVGSMLMRCFSEIYPDERTVRKIFPSFARPIDLIVK